MMTDHSQTTECFHFSPDHDCWGLCYVDFCVKQQLAQQGANQQVLLQKQTIMEQLQRHTCYLYLE